MMVSAMKFSNDLNNFINSVLSTYPGQDTFNRPELEEVRLATGNNKGFREFTIRPDFKVRHGAYSIPSDAMNNLTMMVPVIAAPSYASEVQMAAAPSALMAKSKKVVDMPTPAATDYSLVPQKDSTFVPFGDFSMLKNFIDSKKFFPIYISGESGNGKTKMVYEACARTKRELVRANITESTDEDDLIGGYRLINGETVWQDGPVLEAMKRGAVLLLDEVNLASPKVMCLQPVLEGNPIYVKKTNTLVSPAPGFNVIATANTKGKGSDDGRYIGSNLLNEAFLDRFAVMFEHEYPTKAHELRILNNALERDGLMTEENKLFAEKLVEWAGIIRHTYSVGAINEIISTRRLLHIVKFHSMAGGTRTKAISYCTQRFDEETKQSFLSLYAKIDETIVNEVAEEKKEEVTEEPAF